MIQSFLTLSGKASGEIEINRSRFIGYASPCESEDEALSFLQDLKSMHKSATHHCYAYVIGENSGIMRYSDDGEPGGTAGLPMMETIRSKGLVNCCCIVVRYFGGTLLGTGGLVRAYTKSTQIAIEAAGIARKELTSEEYCELPYSAWDRFRYAADLQPIRIGEIRYGESVSFDLFLRSADRDTVLRSLTEATGRKLEYLHVGETYALWPL